MNSKKSAHLAFESVFVAIATFILSLAVVNAHQGMTATSSEYRPIQQQLEMLSTREVEAVEEQVQEEPTQQSEAEQQPVEETETVDDQPVEETEEEPTEETAAISNPSSVVVKPGDTLGSIASQHNTTFKRLYDANPQIVDPDIINPGQVITIPSPDEKLTERTLPAKKAPAVAVEKVETKVIKPAAVPAKKASTTTSSNASVWDKLAQCESSGNWSINTGNGYYGGLQFSLSSWQFVGGSGYPHQASKQEQINRAEKLLAIQGWGAWPACSAKLGLR
ncbi:TPA: LysM peptidoglycan-binding domain-containing protein [Candidatus Saccharibacteria bacterium]|nr:LysM peptidoglycan-binding domain-containing protein [Candidatus Saccharibacteria bacterium]HIO87255.1 LysM peptidoglycan-binding domain-containing protein [Candidatus Saccharibacteria bacterium]